MYKDENAKPSFSSTKAKASAPRRRAVERGSWYHFLTNSFHGVLGMTSFSVTLSAWIYNEWVSDDDVRSVTSLVLSILSVLLSTILSVHSSWYMLEQSPQQSTILDYKLKLKQTTDKKARAAIDTRTINIKVVAPHRGAFHRTSIIMQYANARILMLLQRRHWHQEQELALPISAPLEWSTSLAGVMIWGLVSLMCLRMLPISNLSKWFCRSPKERTVPSSTADKPSRKIPPFWANGNSKSHTSIDRFHLVCCNPSFHFDSFPVCWFVLRVFVSGYCFVLPMMVGVLADFGMAAWCEYHYYIVHPPSESRDNGSSPPHSLFRYHSLHWLSLWHLFFLQIVAHVIAFSFTLAFRIKSKSNTRNRTGASEARPNASGSVVASVLQAMSGARFMNIRTLYWLCTIGVYVLVTIGFRKATATLTALGL